jgi:DNA-binding transcriptional ArsR family regulator
MTISRPPSLSRRYLRHGMLPQLAAFEAVMRLGSATRAADVLCIAPSTLSGHLRKLGEALGVRLFDIEGKRLVPTDAAQVLLQTTQEVFAALGRCERALAGLPDAPRTAPTGDPAGRSDGDGGCGVSRRAGFAPAEAGEAQPT